ncbi:MAG: hypothetical protein IPJ65_12150 [Archangiaceae bacterium]|nr:hypothetical protein [Archangiaceae bacterium]
MRALAFVAVVSAVAAAAEPEDYSPTGSVSSQGRVATFSADRVVSPTANLSRRADGSWAGTLGARAIDVAVTRDALRGVDVNLTVTRTKGRTAFEGLVAQRPFRLELTEGRIEVRWGQSVQQYVREKDGAWRTLSMATPYGLALEGQAAEPSPPEPQLVLAFIANTVGR